MRVAELSTAKFFITHNFVFLLLSSGPAKLLPALGLFIIPIEQTCKWILSHFFKMIVIYLNSTRTSAKAPAKSK